MTTFYILYVFYNNLCINQCLPNQKTYGAFSILSTVNNHDLKYFVKKSSTSQCNIN